MKPRLTYWETKLLADQLGKLVRCLFKVRQGGKAGALASIYSTMIDCGIQGARLCGIEFNLNTNGAVITWKEIEEQPIVFKADPGPLLESPLEGRPVHKPAPWSPGGVHRIPAPGLPPKESTVKSGGVQLEPSFTPHPDSSSPEPSLEDLVDQATDEPVPWSPPEDRPTEGPIMEKTEIKVDPQKVWDMSKELPRE